MASKDRKTSLKSSNSGKTPTAFARLVDDSSKKGRRERGDSALDRLRRPSEPDSNDKVLKNKRRQERARLSKKIKMTSKTDASVRNPLVTEVVETFLGLSMSVFHARWQTSTCLTDDIISTTPLFWYKRHKWTAQNIKDFFTIMDITLPGRDLDSECKQIYNAKTVKKKKKKKKKHLRKKSMQNLAIVRSKSVKHVHSRSLVVESTDELDTAASRIWILLTKGYQNTIDNNNSTNNNNKTKTELNHAQFNICLNENKISVDPDVSLDLFWELIVNSEEYDKYKEYKNKKKRESHKSYSTSSKHGSKHNSRHSSRHGSRHGSRNNSDNEIEGAFSDNTNLSSPKKHKKKKRKSGKHLAVMEMFENNNNNDDNSNSDNTKNKNKSKNKTKNKTKEKSKNKENEITEDANNSNNRDKYHLKGKRFQSDLLTVKQHMERTNATTNATNATTNGNKRDSDDSDSDNDVAHSPHLKIPEDNISITDLKLDQQKIDESMKVEESRTSVTPTLTAHTKDIDDDLKDSKEEKKDSKDSKELIPTVIKNGKARIMKEKEINNPLIYNPERNLIELREDFTSIKTKKIKKQFITVQHIKKIMKANRKLVKKDDHIKHASELSFKKRNLVIFGKIFAHIANDQPFDVNNDFLAERLTEQQLTDFRFLLNTLDNRKSDWRHRLQVLEYIENNLDLSSLMEPFYEQENFQNLMLAWTAQLYDDRSNITKAAAELFPSVFASLLRNVEPTIIFDKSLRLIDTILESFFVLLRNRRAKLLHDIANDTIIAIVAIISSVAEDCDNESYYVLMEPLLKHSKIQYEKHEVVRAGCISFAGYIIYGIKTDDKNNNSSLNIHSRRNSSNGLSKEKSVGSLSVTSEISEISTTPDASISSENKNNENKDEKKDNNDEKKQNNNKRPHLQIADEPERGFLLKDKTFLEYFDKMLLATVNDKAKEPRDQAMKLLKKMEKKYATLIHDELNHQIFQKFSKWKKYNDPKKKPRNTIRKQRMRISRKALKMRAKAKADDANNENGTNGTNDTNGTKNTNEAQSKDNKDSKDNNEKNEKEDKIGSNDEINGKSENITNGDTSKE